MGGCGSSEEKPRSRVKPEKRLQAPPVKETAEIKSEEVVKVQQQSEVKESLQIDPPQESEILPIDTNTTEQSSISPAMLPRTQYRSVFRLDSDDWIIAGVTIATTKLQASDMVKIRLHTSENQEGEDCAHYYSLKDDCILSTFAHLRGPQMFRQEESIGITCEEDSDLIIAVHQDNPLCLGPEYQRVITNNSYSRIIGCNSITRCDLIKWYRLYHKRVTKGVHNVRFTAKSSYRRTGMNIFTMFIRPCDAKPTLDLTPLEDDSPS